MENKRLMAQGNRAVVFNGEAINLSEISRKTGINVTTLSRIFNGKRNPSLDKAVVIADALNISLDTFTENLPKYQS